MNLLEQLKELRTSNILTAENSDELSKYPTLKELLYLVAIPNESEGLTYWTLPIYDWMGGFSELFSHLIDNSGEVQETMKLTYENRAFGFRLFYNSTNIKVPETLLDEFHAKNAYDKYAMGSLYYKVQRVGKNEWTAFWQPNFVTCAVRYFEATGFWVSPYEIAKHLKPIVYTNPEIESSWRRYFDFGGDPSCPKLTCNPPMKFVRHEVEEESNDI